MTYFFRNKAKIMVNEIFKFVSSMENQVTHLTLANANMEFHGASSSKIRLDSLTM